MNMPPSAPVLKLPSAWSSLEFISDIHLHEQDEATFQAWRHYMLSSQADAIFILGDFFEVWVGDDTLIHAPAGFEAQCVRILRQASQQRPARPIYLMHGNRDFLMGAELARTAQVNLLADPSVLDWHGDRILITHGDALCTDDIPYQAFRQMVRSTEWQKTFLQRPYAERVQIAQGLRQQSESSKQLHPVYTEIDQPLATQWLNANACKTLIHGHTHNPGSSMLGDNMQRHVLSDWVCTAQTVLKGDVLRAKAAQSIVEIERIPLHDIID